MQNTSLQSSCLPACPVFGSCGGCAYQHLSYPEELQLKQSQIQKLFENQLGLSAPHPDPILASPKPYHYRHRLDVGIRKTKEDGFVFGFVNQEKKRLIPIDNCPIALSAVSDFLPELKRQAIEKFTADYRVASLVVKSDDTGRVRWGGIGRRSLRLNPSDYFYTEIRNRKIYYSLDTFFQANLSILPLLMDQIEALVSSHPKKGFLDLYGGVGLFSFALSHLFSKIILIENHPTSTELATYNQSIHSLPSFIIQNGRVEDLLPDLTDSINFSDWVAMIDPPRKGLEPSVIDTLTKAQSLQTLLYLSCNPETLVRDLKLFLKQNWRIERIVPFDFFPKTAHLEVLVKLSREEVISSQIVSKHRIN